MQKRRVAAAAALLAAITASYFLGRHHSGSSTSSAARRHVLYYVDPMHPTYKSDKPGTAPDCGMELQAVYAEGAASASATLTLSSSSLPSGTVSIDDSMQKLLGIRVASVTSGGTARELRVIGRVVPEDTRVYRVNVGVDGFIRDTYNDAPGTLVKKDQKLAIFYSQDFLSVASGFLAASEHVPGATAAGDGNRTVAFPGAVSKQGFSSLQGYTDRLLNLGMSEVQIKHIAETKQLPQNIEIVSPTDGFILARNVTPGQHFDHTMEFYRIVDLTQVWVLAEVDEREAAYVHAGGAARISVSAGGRELAAKVTESLPQSETAGGTVRLRLEVANPGFLLRPDMVVDVKIPVHMPASLTVPADALVDTGQSARVYVERSAGVFESREVETGWRSGEQVEIRQGLRPGERVVVAATFLVDSESRLKSLATPVVREQYRASAKRTAESNCNAVAGDGSVTDQGTSCKDNVQSPPNVQSPSPNLAARQTSGK